MSESAIRVLLVDDHAMLRAGFRTILETQTDIAVVGEAATGADAIAQAAILLPDVITMDVQMPDMDGIEATRLIVADPRIGAAIVIITTFDRDDYLYQALDAGASGFLLKNAGAEDLISAVRALAAGDGMLAPEVTRRVLARFAGAQAGTTGEATTGTAVTGTAVTGTATRGAVTTAGTTTGASAAGAAVTGTAVTGATGGRQVAADLPASAIAAEPSTAPFTAPFTEPFTEREAEVLALLADARTNAEIATALFIGEATVKTHVSRILQKLGARDRVQAVVLAHRRGLA